jgi:hypothetical protein
MPEQPPIIVTGGSVTVELNEGSDEAKNQLKSQGGGKYHNGSKKIDRIEITGDFTYDENTGIATTKNGRVVVSIYVK